MKSTTMTLAGLASLTFLSACGGSSDGGVVFNRTLDPNYGANYIPIGTLGSSSWSANEIADAGGNFVWYANRLNASGLTATVPSAASATYNGSLAITAEVPTAGNPSGRIYYGRMQMSADFTGKTVDGQFGGFGRVNPVQVGGNLLRNVSGSGSFNGVITGSQMASTMTGSVDGNTMDGAMTGTFFTDKDTGRNIINGFTVPDPTSQPDTVGVFLLSE